MKICTHCNQVYPTHKLSCKKTNPEYRLPTAEEFRTIKILDSSHIWTDEELMIEFAKLHVEAALENASHQLDLNGTEADDLVILNKMAQTKKQQKEVKQAMLQSPPKDESSYLFNITGCPGYQGYVPKSLNHEICKYCGMIKYYH